jgi:hypothetical protein
MRFSGIVGSATSVEDPPGVWKEVITEATYFGDVLQQTRRLEGPSLVPPVVHGTIALGNSFSIMADADETYENIINFRYVVWRGNRWEITSAEVKRPRIILTVGGVWNGATPTS